MNKERIIQAIEAYLERETIVTGVPGSQEIQFGGVLNQGHFTHAGFCKEVAEEIAAAIAPHLEAGAGLKPTKFEKDHLPDDVKLSFHKGVGLYQCIKNYELGVLTKYEFIGDIRKVEAGFSPVPEPKDYPYTELFDHMANEHGLTLTNTELGDIIHIARK